MITILENTVQFFHRALFPLEVAVSSVDDARDFFKTYGLTIPDEETLEKLMDFSAISKGYEELKELVLQLKDKDKTWKARKKTAKAAFKVIKKLVDVFKEYKDEASLAFDGVDVPPEKLATLFRDILDDLVIKALMHEYPLSVSILFWYGIVNRTKRKLDAKLPEYAAYTIDWNRFGGLVNPKKALREVYGWGTYELESLKILLNLNNILSIVGLVSFIENVDQDFVQQFYHNQHPLVKDDKATYLSVPIWGGNKVDDQSSYLGLNVLPIPKTPQDKTGVNGLALALIQKGQLASFNNGQLTLDFNLFGGDETLNLSVFPNDIIFSDLPEAIVPSITLKSKNKETQYLIGDKDSIVQVGYKDWNAGLSISDLNAGGDLSLKIKSKDLHFKIAKPDADGFLSEVFKSFETTVKLPTTFYWSVKKGLRVNAQPGLDFVVDVHKGNKILKVLRMRGGLTTFDNAPALKIGMDFNASVGPVQMTAEDIGIQSVISVKENGANNLGFLNFDLDFQSPKSIGVSISAPTVTGGGFLQFDSDNGRYAGVLALKMQALELTAIGLIATRLPNNKKGFSMLVSISTIFRPAIQLSFGFTLNGVGGILGIHRGMNIGALDKRFESGTIHNLMFPRDVVKNAVQVISDLRTVFPPRKNNYVIAPLLKLGWGAPTLITIDLSVLIELPFRNRFLLLGYVAIALPSKSKKLAAFNMSVLGDFNFAEKYIRIRGLIHKANILGIPLHGGFAFVLDWGNHPQFLMSLGGYHPRYKKPSRFPEIPRLSAVIKYGSKVKITAAYYQAITSNSFQIGLTAALLIKFGKVNIKGHLSFDALLQIRPFYFDVAIRIGVYLRYKRKKLGGVGLRFNLSGPGPWRAKGYAKIKIAFFKIKIRFNFSWGRKTGTPKQLVSATYVFNQILQQVRANENWSTQLPSGFKTGAVLHPDSKKKDSLLMHPSGYLQIRQTAAPLNRRIEKLGNSWVTGKPSFKMVNIKAGNKTVQVSAVREYFARGQYQELSDSQKISQKDFEQFTAGARIGDAKAANFGKTGSLHASAANYETILIDKVHGSEPATETAGNWETQRFLIKNRSANHDVYETAGFSTMPDFEADAGYLIVRKTELTLPPTLSAEQPFDTFADADNYLKTELADQVNAYRVMSVEAFEGIKLLTLT